MFLAKRFTSNTVGVVQASEIEALVVVDGTHDMKRLCTRPNLQ